MPLARRRVRTGGLAIVVSMEDSLVAPELGVGSWGVGSWGVGSLG